MGESNKANNCSTLSLEDRVVTRGMVRSGVTSFKKRELDSDNEDLDLENETFYSESGDLYSDDHEDSDTSDEDYSTEDSSDYIDKDNKEKKEKKNKNGYLKTLSLQDREKIKVLEDNIKKINNKTIPLRYKILKSSLEIKTKATLIQSLDNFEEFNSEYYKYVNYIQSLLEIPFGTYNMLSSDIISNPTQFLLDIKSKLDETVYGHNNVKNEILQMLSYQIVNNKTNSQIIGLHGPPGIGKTTIIKDGLANTLKRPFFLLV